jgi:general secretion pathway protein F
MPVLAVLWLNRKRRDPRRSCVLRNALAWLRASWRRWWQKLETARLARTLGTLLRNGVPLLNALGIARNVLGNRCWLPTWTPPRTR